jgi:predicted nucleotidyltransferase
VRGEKRADSDIDLIDQLGGEYLTTNQDTDDEANRS